MKKKLQEFLKALEERVPPMSGQHHHLTLFKEHAKENIQLAVVLSGSRHVIIIEDNDLDNPEQLISDIAALLN